MIDSFFYEQLSVFVEFFKAILLSGVATTMAVEVLKSKYIPIAFQNYKRLTTIGVSVAASVFAVFSHDPSTLGVDSWPDVAAIFSGTLLIAVVTYNNLLKSS